MRSVTIICTDLAPMLARLVEKIATYSIRARSEVLSDTCLFKMHALIQERGVYDAEAAAPRNKGLVGIVPCEDYSKAANVRSTLRGERRPAGIVNAAFPLQAQTEDSSSGDHPA